MASKSTTNGAGWGLVEADDGAVHLVVTGMCACTRDKRAWGCARMRATPNPRHHAHAHIRALAHARAQAQHAGTALLAHESSLWIVHTPYIDNGVVSTRRQRYAGFRVRVRQPPQSAMRIQDLCIMIRMQSTKALRTK